MENINWRFSDRVRSHLVKVKFYNKKPGLTNAKRLTNVRFCEATKEAVLHPVILDRDSISCPGAQYAFGWSFGSGNRKDCLTRSLCRRLMHGKDDGTR